jgi:hypothetical protein
LPETNKTYEVPSEQSKWGKQRQLRECRNDSFKDSVGSIFLVCGAMAGTHRRLQKTGYRKIERQ